MRSGRKLRSKNSRAGPPASRPAATARLHTCFRAKYIGRASLGGGMVRNSGRQLVRKAAKATA
jgi:hypothetical protein